jgi:BMFP domain-containing protein YqiC
MTLLEFIDAKRIEALQERLRTSPHGQKQARRRDLEAEVLRQLRQAAFGDAA